MSTYYPLHKFQHAYIVGKSTETALIELTSRIDKSLNKNEHTMAAFLDIEGAFDNTQPISVIKALEKRAVHPTITSFIRTMLTTRNITVEYEAESDRRSLLKGCPQGGVLSPLLWNIVVDDLIELVNNSGIFCQGYADDVVVMVSGKQIETLSEVLNNAFGKIERWCCSNKLTVNPRKSHLIIFTKKRKINLKLLPTLFGEFLLPVNDVKYLGVVLDTKLKWNKHVDSKIKKAKTILWQCRRVVTAKWGLEPKQMLWIYTAIVRPLMTYACTVWHSYINNSSNVQILNRMNRSVCLLVTGSIKSTPGVALEILLGLEPLPLFIESTVLKTTHRFILNKNLINPSLKKKLYEIAPSAKLPSDRDLKKNVYIKKYTIEIGEKTDIVKKLKNKPLNNISCFTDGSLSEIGAGAGHIIFEDDTVIHEFSVNLGANCTVFQTEIIALINAAKELKNYENKFIQVYSDSQAALLALSRWETTSKLVAECIESLNEVGCNNILRLNWVPGHCDIQGNELADLQANIGAAKDFCGPLPVVPVPWVAIKNEICDYILSVIIKSWQNLTTCRQTKMFFPVPSTRKSQDLLNLKRNDLKLICSILTGHCLLRKHLTVMGLSDEPTCPKCGFEEDTPEHLITNCSSYNILRKNVLGGKTLCKSKLECTKIPSLLSFIKNSGRLEFKC